ncbi:hypothetical protein B0H16DRAFT_1718439 [Mycena metata]|uniref:Uncharacterized protein n=1 Tax=Mycena metata TaxID=1033252 RepID=A0AAD7NJJ2_9AGAR|nr:hypothetical protein B0H16DRAFT_1718439 [Mycena metata]
MASSFQLYSTPHPSTQYSATFFGTLSFRTASGIQYPRIHPPKSLYAWTYSKEVPTEGVQTVEAGDFVPHLDDLSPIIKGMESAFGNGARSVAATFTAAGRTQYRLYSFSKTLDRFLSQCIHAKIFGFHVTDFPLWKLGCLLGEELLHEGALNALTELLFFSTAAVSHDVDPTTIILPTSVLRDARYLYAQSPRLLSSNLDDLHTRLRSTRIHRLYALDCISNHYSSYRDNTPSKVLDHADSLNASDGTQVLPVLQWILSGTGRSIPGAVGSAGTAQQSAGSGSCGIAALNFIQSPERCKMDWSDQPPVSASSSARPSAVPSHCRRSRFDSELKDWVVPVPAGIDGMDTELAPDEPFGSFAPAIPN